MLKIIHIFRLKYIGIYIVKKKLSVKNGKIMIAELSENMRHFMEYPLLDWRPSCRL